MFGLKGFPHPRTARHRPSSIIGHTTADGNGRLSSRSQGHSIEKAFRKTSKTCCVGRSTSSPVYSRCASSATLLSEPVPARNAPPEIPVRCRARIRKPNLAEGSALARRKGFPNSLPRCACADLRFARPPLCSGWEIPLPLRLAAPPSPGGVRHVGTCHAWHEKQRQQPRRKHP
jgi:hypothetical protein